MRLGLGLVGLGTAGAAMLSAALRRPDVRVVAVADTQLDSLGLDELDGLEGCRRHRTIEALLDDDEVDAVHIATPTPLHYEQVVLALEAGRAVIVEKPVTADSESATRLAVAAASHDRVAVVGHSESFEPYARAARDAIAGGEIGSPVMIFAEKFTDWMRRPRLPEEWSPDSGGGVIRRQGVHQVDVLRTLVDRDYEVRAARTRLDPEREAPGSYFAWLHSAGGPDAFITHDGVGRLSAVERLSAVGRLSAGAPGVCASAAAGDEASAKRARTRLLLERALAGEDVLKLGGGDLERVVVIGTEGEIVASRTAVDVRTGRGRRAVELDGYPSGRDAVLDELLGSLMDGRRAIHDLAWGAENLRLCEEIDRVSRRELVAEGRRS